ncbi:putative membrane protein [Micromonospora pisi]|uniref:Putative membrane protein n=1 Tax=Micromonospora pisi TaxID=589240 RepID=A0A495JQG2_9ACTN|nr:cytochrome c oxidase assembly protein [Micromonospora pisi]RKR90289.1 putative membrane protein [Micromonospora pisi]
MTDGLAHSTLSDGGRGWLPIFAVVVLTGCYLAAAGRARRTTAGWRPLRAASFVVGAGLLAVAFSPVVASAAHHDVRAHMVQHLLVGMYAPLALTLAAPMTLALRTLPGWGRRGVTSLLRSRVSHLLSRPVTVLLLNVGGLYVVYLTPLYVHARTNEALHIAVHVHLFLAGYLFAWFAAGPDPAPRRPSLSVRLSVLVLAAAAHAVLAKLLYARASHWPPGAALDPGNVRDAAQLMYYGGDLAELLLAVAVFTAWGRRRTRRARPSHPVAETSVR